MLLGFPMTERLLQVVRAYQDEPVEVRESTLPTLQAPPPDPLDFDVPDIGLPGDDEDTAIDP